MAENTLEKIFEHNNWANSQIIRACYALSDEQLDAIPEMATKGSIRETLMHLVSSQAWYLALLTESIEQRSRTRPAFDELEESARASGEGLTELARNKPLNPSGAQLQTSNSYLVAPWVVRVQAINHATEHREQIKSMLSALGVTPPDIDGWSFGETTSALIPMST